MKTKKKKRRDLINVLRIKKVLKRANNRTAGELEHPQVQR